MKKVFLSAFILMVGMLGTAMAQEPKTKAHLERVRKYTEQNLKEKNTSDEIYQKLKIELNQRINHQIFILNLPTQPNPVDELGNRWKKITSEDGTTLKWSGLVPGRYANCISIKNKDGKPIDDNGNPVSDPWVQCKTTNGVYDGTSKEKDPYGNYTVLRSDAEAACSNVGGRLPTKEEFEKFQKNETFVNLPETEYHWFWSSSVGSGDPNFAYFFDGNFDYVDFYDVRFSQNSVRCVGR